MDVQDDQAAAFRSPPSRGLIVDAMMKSGLPAADAAKVAELMLEADLTGADAHGVFRLPQYVLRLKLGGAQSAAQHHGRRAPRRRPRWSTATTAWAIWWWRAPPKPRSSSRARSGVAWVGMRKSNHAGAAGVYAALPLQGRHDRHLCRGRQRQPHAAGRRRRAAARHQSAGDRHSGRRGAAAGARHRHLDRLLRHHQEPPPAEHAHCRATGWSIRKRAKPVTDPQEKRRGAAVADGRLQGRGAGADARPTRRHAQRRAVRPRLRRLQRRAGRRSTIPGNSWSRSTRRASRRSTPSRPRSTAISANCARRRRCPATSVRLPGEERASAPRRPRCANGLHAAPANC